MFIVNIKSNIRAKILVLNYKQLIHFTVLKNEFNPDTKQLLNKLRIKNNIIIILMIIITV